MSTTPPKYRLVLFGAVDDPAALRDAVAQVTGIHPTDAVQWLARTPGTWPQPLEDTVVRKLLDVLFDAGIAAEAWRTDLFPELSPLRTIHRAACVREGLRIEGLRAEPTHWVPWNCVELISAGKIGAEDEFRQVEPPRWPSTVVAGIRALALMKPRPVSRRDRAMRTPRDPVSEVIIVRRDPRIAFRVVENQMNYAYLGERLSDSAAENFPIFLSELCDGAMNAYITDSTRSLLDHGELSEHEFPSSHALVEYSTHRLLWSWYRRDRALHWRSPDRETIMDDQDSDVARDADPDETQP